MFEKVLLFILTFYEAYSKMIRSYPQHELSIPSNDLAVLYYSHFINSRLKNQTDHRSPLVKMNIKSKRPCLNVDNIFGLESLVCRDNQMHMKLHQGISISHWNISNGVTFLVNPHWKCMGIEQAVFLHSESCLIISTKELIFNVEQIHPQNVTDEYEFIIRPNNDYHRDILLRNDRSTLKMDKNEYSHEKTDKGKVFDVDLSNKSWNIMYTNRIPSPTFSATLHCISCHVSGTAALYSNLKGLTTANRIGAIFKTGISSAFNANLSMILEIREGLRMIEWRHSLLKLDIFPFSIPGLFKLEAAIWIDAVMYFSLFGKGNITIDFRFNHPQALTEIEIGQGNSQILNKPSIKPITHIKLEHPLRNFSVFGVAMISPSIGLRFGLFDKPIDSILGMHFDVGISSDIDLSYDPFSKIRDVMFSECPAGTFKFSQDTFFKTIATIGKLEHYLWKPEIENIKRPNHERKVSDFFESLLIMTIFTFLLLLFKAFAASSHTLVSFPKHEFGAPSQELIALYHSGHLDSSSLPLGKESNRSPLVKMNIKSKLPCLNVDNIFGLESLVCRDNQMHRRNSKRKGVKYMSVLLETSLGEIVIDLYIDKCPKASLNFMKLCKVKYYNFSLFHNVQKGFMAQTGKPAAIDAFENGESVWGLIHGANRRFFVPELHPKLKHNQKGLVSMATVTADNGVQLAGSQFFITLSDSHLDYLDNKMAVFGVVAEGLEILDAINETITDSEGVPFKDIRIKHTIILDDPFDDPSGLIVPDRSPILTEEMMKRGRIGEDYDEEEEDLDPEELDRRTRKREAEARALTLEMVGDLPFAEVKPPENVLFVCKLNRVTRDDDLELIFSRFGKILSCEIIRDPKTGESLQYAFIEFQDKESCEEAYFKMDNVLIDDRRIHVDFSQSVSKLHQDFLRGDRNPMQESFGGSSNLKRKTHYRDEGDSRSKYDLVFEHSGNLSGEKKRKNSSYEDTTRSNDKEPEHRSRDRSHGERDRSSRDNYLRERERYSRDRDRSRDRWDRSRGGEDWEKDRRERDYKSRR